MKEKYGVAQDPEKTKTAQRDPEGPAKCPECGAAITKHGDVLKCPNCGTRPFERKTDG